MKQNRISAGILLALGILVLLYTGSYGMFCVLAAALFLLLCMALYTVHRQGGTGISLPSGKRRKESQDQRKDLYRKSFQTAAFLCWL